MSRVLTSRLLGKLAEKTSRAQVHPTLLKAVRHTRQLKTHTTVCAGSSMPVSHAGAILHAPSMHAAINVQHHALAYLIYCTI